MQLASSQQLDGHDDVLELEGAYSQPHSFVKGEKYVSNFMRFVVMKVRISQNLDLDVEGRKLCGEIFPDIKAG